MPRGWNPSRDREGLTGSYPEVPRHLEGAVLLEGTVLEDALTLEFEVSVVE